MTTSRIAAILVGTLAVAIAGAAALDTGGVGKAAAQQSSPPACICAPATTVTAIGSSLVHCQCGPATCVVSENITGQSKTYGFQCVK